jgi:hypothetical protein
MSRGDLGEVTEVVPVAQLGAFVQELCSLCLNDDLQEVRSSLPSEHLKTKAHVEQQLSRKASP